MQKKRNSKSNKLKQTKGITLIALIITIIVLLILAGVTINLTLGENGIFKTAQLAAKNYTNAQEKELIDLAKFNNTLNDTIKDDEKVQLVTEISLNKTEINLGIGSTETLTATISPDNVSNKNLTWTSSNTDVATVSNGTITAVAKGTTTITVTAEDGSGKNAICNVTVEEPTLASEVRPGDYVEYDGGNGYTGLWQVLYNDSTYGLQIISANSVNSYQLGGGGGYANAVDRLNTECRKYVNRSYATSGRCVGTHPLSQGDTSGSTYWRDQLYKNADSNFTTDYNAMKEAKSQRASGIHMIDQIYWLASRSRRDGTYSATFYVRSVWSDGVVKDEWMFSVNGDGSDANTVARGLRPVVTLKSGIQTDSGDGSQGSPYKLVAQ